MFQNQINRSSDILERLYGINKEELEKDYFVLRKKIPLGTKKPIEEYYDSNGKIDIEYVNSETVYRKIDTEETFNALFIAGAGTYKSSQIFRWMHYYNKLDYNCLIFDPKSYGLSKLNKPGNGKRIHPFEKPEGLPIHGCLPSFVMKKNTPKKGLENSLSKTFKTKFSLRIDQLDEPSEWSTIFDSSISGGLNLVKLSKKYKDPVKILEVLNKVIAGKLRKEQINTLTAKGLIPRMEHIISEELFSLDYHELDVKSLWEMGKILNISFFNRAAPFIRFTVGKTVERIKMMEEHLKNKSRKLIFYDDCTSYLAQFNQAVQVVRMAIYDWRVYNFNQVFAVQSIKAIDTEILDSCRDKYICNMGNTDELSSYISNNVRDLIKNLVFDDKVQPFNVEYAKISKTGRTAESFYPFWSLCNNKK